MIECLNCEVQYDPTACRWACPACHAKDTCCEGAALTQDEEYAMLGELLEHLEEETGPVDPDLLKEARKLFED